MSFFSTRGGAAVTASQAILYGLAPDGGLYGPAMFPPVSQQKLAELTQMDYCQRASTILRTYLEDFSIPEIDAALAAAYDEKKFDDPAIAPMKKLDDETWVLELFHGPTLAFKDMALQLLPHLTTLSARKNGEEREVSILVATSGDTGKAALEGFKDVPGTSCTVFYPTDGVSDVQKLQMTTTGGDNTHVIGINGNFDDAQTGVKTLFGSAEFNAAINEKGKVLSSANSINFGRLVPQVVYYFSAYADLVNEGAINLGDPVNFVVPTGNFGNILAAYSARSMGLPVNKLICASNRNNVLTDFFRNGIYDTRRQFYKTTSPSMDILISSNLERLLFELSDHDDALLRDLMGQLAATGRYTVPADIKEKLDALFAAGWCDDDEVAATIRDTFNTKNYLCDTHTAVVVKVYNDYRRETEDTTATVIASTANPYKFSASVLEALGADKAEWDEFEQVEQLHKAPGAPVPAPLASLKGKTPRFTQVCDKQEMRDMVQALLNAQ